MEIPFEPEKINAILGTSFTEEEMLGYFKLAELDYDASRRVVIAPTFRQDLKRTCDLAEEVARFYGYEILPGTYQLNTSQTIYEMLRIMSQAPATQ